MELSEKELMEIKKLEERLWIAEFRSDNAWMGNVLADDFFEFGRSGKIYSRTECLAIEVDDKIDVVMPLPEFKARYLGNDTIQTTYKSIVQRDGKIEYGNRSSIWLKVDNGWKLKFHQGTPALSHQQLQS